MINSLKFKMLVKLKLFTEIGRGSARIVYDLGNGTVAKIARSKKGIAQNRTEVNICKKDKDKGFGVFAQVLNHNKCYSIIIVEKCQIAEGGIWKIRELINTREKNENGFWNLINQLEKKYDLIQGDIDRYNSWGINSQGKAVLIDYGCTNRVYDRHYGFF